MQIRPYLVAGTVLFCVSAFDAKSQDLLKMLDSAQGSTNAATSKPILSPTWKDTRLIDVQTTKTPAPGVMEFRIMHRFGNIGGQSGGGVHTLYGFDIASDILFGFEFGITKNLMLGISRSKQQELIDGTIKYRFLTQQSSGMPISAAFYGDAGITPETSTTLYNGADSASLSQSIADRLSYIGELIIDRRFNDHVSLEIIGGISHRNYVLANINADNNATDQNTIPYIAAGGRFMFNKHSGIVFDYYYLFSQYRINNTGTPYFPPLSIGYEVETGGHVFEINFTNASYLDENNIIPSTRDTWTKGGFKLGFSISRVFNAWHAK
jgi:hypothetical protein